MDIYIYTLLFWQEILVYPVYESLLIPVLTIEEILANQPQRHLISPFCSVCAKTTVIGRRSSKDYYLLFLLSSAVNEWITNFEKKVKPLWESTQQIPDTEATQLGKKDPDVYPWLSVVLKIWSLDDCRDVVFFFCILACVFQKWWRI